MRKEKPIKSRAPATFTDLFLFSLLPLWHTEKFNFADYNMKVEYDEYCVAQLVLNLKKDQGISLKKSASLKSDSREFAKGVVRLILAGLK